MNSPVEMSKMLIYLEMAAAILLASLGSHLTPIPCNSLELMSYEAVTSLPLRMSSNSSLVEDCTAS